MKQKTFPLLILTTIICISAITQPTIKTQRVAGGSGDDRFASMYLTKDKGYILGGSSASNVSGEKTENSRGGYDYWVIKLDSSLNIQWDKTIGGSSYDRLTSLQQTNDGGYILGGSSNSNISGEKTENSRMFSNDYWVVKLDSNLKIQWDKTIGGSGDDELLALQQSADGGYILGGYSSSNISGEKTGNNRCGCNDYNNPDYWVVKLDSVGNIQWDKTIGGSEGDYFQCLQQTNDGGYVVGGYSHSHISGEKTEKRRGGYDYWVIKLDSTGKIEWDKTIGGSNNDHLQSLKQNKEGGFVLAGSSESPISGEKTQRRRGHSYDYWLIKIDSLGQIEWDKTIGGAYGDYLTSLQQTSDSGYILGGYSYSNISNEKTENSRGLDDYWIIKLDSTGKIKWDKTIGGNGYDECYSVAEIGRNHYLVAGFSDSKTTGDKKRLNRGPKTTSDYWLVDLFNKTGNDSAAVTINEITATPAIINNKSFTIYPNPAKDILHIQTTGKATYTLINQAGKIMLTKTIDNSGSINTAQLPAGLYYIKNNNTGEVQKIIIER